MNVDDIDIHDTITMKEYRYLEDINPCLRGITKH